MEYEGLHQICFECGQYGHRAETCMRNPNNANPSKEGSVNTGETTAAKPVEEDHSSGGFRPWMLPSYARRRGAVSRAPAQRNRRPEGNNRRDDTAGPSNGIQNREVDNRMEDVQPQTQDRIFGNKSTVNGAGNRNNDGVNLGGISTSSRFAVLDQLEGAEMEEADDVQSLKDRIQGVSTPTFSNPAHERVDSNRSRKKGCG